MFRLFRTTALWVLLLPYAVSFAGAASNQLVLNANGDTFPVRINAIKVSMMETRTGPDGIVYIDPIHVVMTPKTHLNWLADILDFHDVTYSIGDLFIEFGNWLQTFCPFVWIAVVAGKLRRP